MFLLGEVLVALTLAVVVRLVEMEERFDNFDSVQMSVLGHLLLLGVLALGGRRR